MKFYYIAIILITRIAVRVIGNDFQRNISLYGSIVLVMVPLGRFNVDQKKQEL